MTDRFYRSQSLRMNNYAPLMIVPYIIKTGPSPRRAFATQTITTQAPE